jgi:peroxiredoxin
MKIYLWLATVILSVRVASADIPLFESPRLMSEEGGIASAYKVGDVVSNFNLRNVDGSSVALSDYSNVKGVVVIFTSNHCPFAKAYEDRILALNNKYASKGFPVIAINPTDPVLHQDDAFERMKERATAKGYNYPYLVDDAQRVAKAFGTSRTPEAFVLQKSGAKFIVQYIGMIDDNPQDPSGATRFYVDEAVANLLSGKPVATTLTKPVGCVVKLKD